MASREELTSFIGATFRSVWALEVLCHLLQDPDSDHPPAEVVAALRASDSVVRRSFADLAAAGLVTIAEGGARYAPATERLAELAAAAQARYASAPDAVRRTIVRAANPDLTAFSDAFRLREE
jgi:DNA-binding IclR family transcriptional regulator